MTSSSSLPTSQRANQFNPPDALSTRLNQVAPVPPFPSSGVATLVRVLSASLNPVDYKLAALPQPLPRLMVGSAPLTPGMDFVGRVWKTTHPDLKPGDIVWGMLAGIQKYGTCAEFTVVKGTGSIVKVPDGWLDLPGRKLEELGGVGVAGLTALRALRVGILPWDRTNGKEGGGKVFINGASGGVGTYAVQVAKAMGVETVVASCSGANADLVRSLGADEVVDYRSQDLVQALKDWSGKNGGQTFDLVVDNVGADMQLYWQSPHYLKSDGKYVQVGSPMNLKSTLDLVKINLWPTILWGGTRAYHFIMLANTKAEEFELVGKWMVEGKVKTVIEDNNRFDLAATNKAFETLKNGRTRGKIMITVAEDGQ